MPHRVVIPCACIGSIALVAGIALVASNQMSNDDVENNTGASTSRRRILDKGLIVIGIVLLSVMLMTMMFQNGYHSTRIIRGDLPPSKRSHNDIDTDDEEEYPSKVSRETNLAPIQKIPQEISARILQHLPYEDVEQAMLAEPVTFGLEGQRKLEKSTMKIVKDEHGYVTEEWRDDAGNLHRLDGPARSRKLGVFDQNTRYPFYYGEEEWYNHGKRHRLGGPARKIVTGTVLTKQWFINDQPFNASGGPSRADYDARTGVLLKEYWANNGILSRDDGPAYRELVSTDPKCPRYRLEWYRNNQRHREDGPAVVNEGVYPPDREWWLNGERQLHNDNEGIENPEIPVGWDD